MTRIKSDRIVTPEGLFSGYVYFEKGKIREVSKKEKNADECFDYTGKYVSAGFIDIHTHGALGCEFAGTAEDVIKAANYHFEHGTTTIYPTYSAAPLDTVMTPAMESLKKAMVSQELKPCIFGAHLEGPYLSTKQVGGQAADFITPPKKEDYMPFLEKYGDFVARMSYAVENDEANELLKALKKHNVVAAIGHSDAIYDEVKSAFDEGCRLVTHLYSCTSTITRVGGFRRLGIIEAAYLLDDMYVEIIADGRHLPPDLIKLILKIKGRDKVCLITDSLVVAGLDVKEGTTLGGVEYVIEDDVCKLRDRSAFAGSIATADRLIRVMTGEVGVSVADAVYMMTAVPAKIMGIDSFKGKLEEGYDADIVVFDDNINIEKIFSCKQ